MPPPRLTLASQSTLAPYARTNGRGVHLRIHPRPANISESRKILSVLQQYGDVVMYQNLKYDPDSKAENIALALYKENAEADSLVAASPLKLEMGSSGVKQLSMDASGAISRSAEGEEKFMAPASSYPKYFNFIFDFSKIYFQLVIRRQHYYSSFRPNTHDQMFQDLQTKVPVAAMADCQVGKGEVPLRLRIKELRAQELEKRGLWRVPLKELQAPS